MAGDICLLQKVFPSCCFTAAAYRTGKPAMLADGTWQTRNQAEGILRKIMGSSLTTCAMQDQPVSEHGQNRRTPLRRRAIVIGVMLSVFQQFVGINVVLTTRRKCLKR